jgi:hypothetical protein
MPIIVTAIYLSKESYGQSVRRSIMKSNMIERVEIWMRKVVRWMNARSVSRVVNI